MFWVLLPSLTDDLWLKWLRLLVAHLQQSKRTYLVIKVRTKHQIIHQCSAVWRASALWWGTGCRNVDLEPRSGPTTQTDPAGEGAERGRATMRHHPKDKSWEAHSHSNRGEVVQHTDISLCYLCKAHKPPFVCLQACTHTSFFKISSALSLSVPAGMSTFLDKQLGYLSTARIQKLTPINVTCCYHTLHNKLCLLTSQMINCVALKHKSM